MACIDNITTQYRLKTPDARVRLALDLEVETISSLLPGACHFENSDFNWLDINLSADGGILLFADANSDEPFGRGRFFEFYLDIGKIAQEAGQPYLNAIKKFDDLIFRKGFEEADKQRRAAHEKFIAALKKELPDQFIFRDEEKASIFLRSLSIIWIENFLGARMQQVGETPVAPRLG